MRLKVGRQWVGDETKLRDLGEIVVVNMNGKEMTVILKDWRTSCAEKLHVENTLK